MVQEDSQFLVFTLLIYPPDINSWGRKVLTLHSIVDTGINSAHTEFGGRASLGYSAVSGTTDTSGHGTHVAGTIIGTTYGVAKAAKVVAVKVFTGDEGTTSDVLDGYDWAVNDIISKGRQTVSAVSMSLGMGFFFF